MRFLANENFPLDSVEIPLTNPAAFECGHFPPLERERHHESLLPRQESRGMLAEVMRLWKKVSVYFSPSIPTQKEN